MGEWMIVLFIIGYVNQMCQSFPSGCVTFPPSFFFCISHSFWQKPITRSLDLTNRSGSYVFRDNDEATTVAWLCR